MTNKQPYPEEFKIEAVKQITERGHRVADVSARIGVSQHSLYKWIKLYAVPAPERQAQASQTEELRRLTDRRFNRMRPSIAPRKRHQAG